MQESVCLHNCSFNMLIISVSSSFLTSTLIPLTIDQPSASIWECLPDKCQDGALWHREAATACAVTNLIKDLSLSNHNGHPSTSPSKRQCRSLSFSDEMASCRTSWRPLGSKFWAPVKKRRCYNGGSVQRYSNRFSTMQQSSSFSLPSHANAVSLPYDPAGLHPQPIGPPGLGVLGPATCGQVGDLWGHAASPVGGGRLDMQRSLSCSHDQFSFADYCPPSASSTPPRRQSRPGARVGWPTAAPSPASLMTRRTSLTSIRVTGCAKQLSLVTCICRFCLRPTLPLDGKPLLAVRLGSILFMQVPNALLCRHRGPPPLGYCLFWQKLEKLSSFTLNKETLISHKEYRKFFKTTTVGTIWELKEKSAYVKDEHLECAAAERVICLCALSFNFTENMVKYVT
ncbi:hypothetical protein MG293_011162 [Ovis ammon polii]|uniref:Protein FAM53B n=1 Tax=Ovis ammon polii TaxID=230172 RepID=A0AAD4U8C0_OVIAM|nr:hypothetical protein MG293_011162 [Ovis ammon polii]